MKIISLLGLNKRPAPPDLSETLGVAVRHSARARRLTLRIDPHERRAVLVIPPGTPVQQAHDFVTKNQGWIEHHLSALPEIVPYGDGSTIPFLGTPHTIRHVPAARRGVWREGDVIYVSGAPEHLPRRTADWLKDQARREISVRAHPLAEQIGRTIRRITVRDTRSRWGSCTARGDLSFSWRLILAPETVLAYVVAHEVAHLREAHHGPSFWSLVRALHPSCDADRQWLKRNGSLLRRYG